MFQSFTGTSRRPRQVNLSGRPSNPFGSAQNAVASAQQDRMHRAQQRERLQASSRIQKTWRGHRSRRRTFTIWRQIWDEQEEKANGAYTSEEESLRQLRRLMLFFSPRAVPSDTNRLSWYGTRQITTTGTVQCEGKHWSTAYHKLQSACIRALRARARADADVDRTLLGILAFSARKTKFRSSKEATEYYDALTSTGDLPLDPLQGALLAPLTTYPEAYEGLVVLLVKPLQPGMLKLLQTAVDPSALSKAVASLQDHASMPARDRIWLLGNIIVLTDQRIVQNVDLTAVLAHLLGSLAEDVDFGSTPMDLDNTTFDREVLSKITTGFPLNGFLHMRIESLVDQDSIRTLLSPSVEARGQAHILAGYALTLMRCFSRRADEIRMWLYRGPVSHRSSSTQPTEFLFNAAKGNNVFRAILASSKGVATSLKDSSLKNDWTVILIFLELYSFVLKIMDDEEFLRPNAVDIPVLVTFLKNLGFSLYMDASDLNRTLTSSSGPSARTLLATDIPGLVSLDYLKGLTTGVLRAIYDRDSRRNILPKGHWLMTERFDMVTFISGVVEEEDNRRAIEEQDEDDGEDDSEEELDMGFGARISTSGHSRVVQIQAARDRQLRKNSQKRRLEEVAPRLEILQNLPFFIPFDVRVQIFRELVSFDQIKRRNGVLDPDMWRQNMLMAIQAQNMPPRNPLARHHAQIKRGHEFRDAFDAFYELGPDLKEPIQISFVDAFDMPEAGIDGGGVTKEFLTSVISQAFDPVSDRQGPDIYNFFVENDKHLLYPNPELGLQVAQSQRDFEALGSPGVEEIDGYAQLNPSNDPYYFVRDMLKRYEFLGRIIGKCLYEGILVDVNFAGFFLKKWALTGGVGHAPMETSYRASINDLRDLDEELYRGLISLKHADNAEEFGLYFTVDDVWKDFRGKQHVSEVQLIDNGANVPVTNENRLLYINALSHYRLQRQSARQTGHFLRGLGTIIQPSWLSMFNQSELQTLIGGAAAGIDVQDLRRNTMYGGTYVIGDDGQEHPSVQRFWNVMQQMSDEDRRKVLKFVTSTPRGPLLGFSHLNPKFSIRDSGSDENRFPTTSTCVNLLKLPMYKTEKMLQEKLLAAVNSGAGFDLS